MQRKHVGVAASQDFVAYLSDELRAVGVQPLRPVIRDGGSLLQRGVGGDHLGRHQLPADAEVFKRALCLRAPKLIGGHIDLAEAVRLLARSALRRFLRNCRAHSLSLPVRSYAKCRMPSRSEGVKDDPGCAAAVRSAETHSAQTA